MGFNSGFKGLTYLFIYLFIYFMALIAQFCIHYITFQFNPYPANVENMASS